MIQDIQHQNDDITINSTQIAVLKEHFPACFKADGSFDIIRFQEEIKDQADVVHEGYELKFLGKSYAKLLASTDTVTVLQPNEAHNSLPENANSENIYISGDNLDGLKHLLKSYQNSVKCIYIDPPYNTGSDGFIYHDSFNYTLENLQEKLNVTEEEAIRILDLTKRGSASHSAWLLFMYSRLLLARDLLTVDGVIFISIDDNEQANLKLLCDDVFGEENHVGQFIVNSSPSGIDYGHMGKTNDYALFYTKNTLEAKTNQLEEAEKEFKYEDKEGGFNLYPLYNGNSSFNDKTRPNLIYPFYVNPIKNSNDEFHEISLTKIVNWIEVFPVVGLKDKIQRVWRWGRIKSAKYLNDQIVGLWNRDGEYRIMQKSRLTSKVIRSLQLDNEVSSRRGTLEIESLFGKKVFSYPKPSNYIKRLITVGTEQDSTVLDFFSGSASTAHAVMQLNAEDGGNRKFIAVQLPEVLREEDASQSIAYYFLQENNMPTTLDYIGIERIKRASAKIKAEQMENTKSKAKGLFKEDTKQEIDLGFKHYSLVEPNQNTLDKLETFDKAGLLADTTILDDFGKQTILATWLNADGYGLTATAQVIDLAGYTAYYYQKHIYLIDEGFKLESMKVLLLQYDSESAFNPENVVLFGYSFPDWSISEMIDKNLRILNDSEKNLKINFAVRY
jgi:adenine-specific DNA-methyltransferase